MSVTGKYVTPSDLLKFSKENNDFVSESDSCEGSSVGSSEDQGWNNSTSRQMAQEESSDVHIDRNMRKGMRNIDGLRVRGPVSAAKDTWGSEDPRQRREVYRMPTEKDTENGSLLLWPLNAVISIIGFQMKLMVYSFSFAGLLFSICQSMLMDPVHRTMQAKHKVSGRISYGIAVVSQINQMIWDAITEVKPTLQKLGKKVGYGFLAASYVTIMLGFLFVLALLLDFLFVGRFIEEPVQIRERLQFDYTQSHPSDVVPLFPAHVMPRGKSFTRSDTKKIIGSRSIPVSHSFHMTVILTLPESDHNLHLGMFQVTAEILSGEGQVLARFSQPCMLRYHSSPIRYAKTALMAFPLVVGLYVESQMLVLHVVPSYEDKPPYASCARLLLEPRAGFAAGSGLPEIYASEVIVESELPWLKALAYNWKWTCYVWAAVFIYLVEIFMILCCCRQVLIYSPRVPGAETIEEGGSKEQENGFEERSPEDLIPRRQFRRRKVTFRDEPPNSKAVSGLSTQSSDIEKFVQKELEALSGTKEKLESSAQDMS